MAQFVNASFVGTAGTGLSAHDSNWTLHPTTATGGCVISNANRCRRNNNNTTIYYHAGTPASADYEVEAPLFAKETDGGASSTGVTGRTDTTAATFYHARYGGGTTDGWQLFKFVGGTPTQLGSTSSQSLTDETSNAVKLRMVGTTIELYKQGGGTATISVTDSAISAAGKVGIRFVGTGETDTTGLHIDGPLTADDIGGAASHDTSGALASDAATIAGTAAHLTLHATSGALASDAAAIAGTAAHATLHATSGALAADAATIAGDAEYTADGGTHATSGALSADAATLAGVAVHSGEGAVVEAPATGGGGWAWAAPRKTRHAYLSPPTREQMAERVRKQREALGILPKPAQKRIEAAVKKEARRAAPDIAELAPVAAEVAQDTGASLQAVINAIAAAYETQRGLVAARMEADAAQRREAEAQAAEQARMQAEAAEREWQERLPRLLADDEALLERNRAARMQAVETIRQVQKALLALIG